MVVKVDMSADDIIAEMLAAPEIARLAELSAALGNIFKDLEPDAQRGAGPSKTLPTLLAEADAAAELLKKAKTTVNTLAKGLFATEDGVSTLQAVLKENVESTISILQSVPHAIAPLAGIHARQWVFDWILPWRFVRETAFRYRDALVPAIRASAKADTESTVARDKAQAFKHLHEGNIETFHRLEGLQSRLSHMAKGAVTSKFLFEYAHGLTLEIPGEDLHHCQDPAFHLLMVEQLGRKARVDDLVVARPSDGAWGKAALLHFSQAATCWDENTKAYENRFAESSTDPEVLPFADQGMIWARTAMADMIETAAVIRADTAMRHEAQQDTSGSGSLLAQVNAFWNEHVEGHKRHGGGGGDGGAEAAINAWSSKTADTIGDTRGVWNGYSAGFVLGD